jgi:5'-methylthioinosine phosphorylase
MSMLGIIGGTGLATLEGLRLERRDAMSTPWGEPSAPLLHGRPAASRSCSCAARHRAHAIAPHAVNYRANIWALREQACTRSSPSTRSAASTTPSRRARSRYRRS